MKFELLLETYYEDDDPKQHHTYLRFFGKSFRIPNIIKPMTYIHRFRKTWEEGKPWGSYEVHASRQYGFYYFNCDKANHFVVKFGIQDPIGTNLSDDGFKEKHWSCFLPWNEWKLKNKTVLSFADGYILDGYDGQRIDTNFQIVRYEFTRGIKSFSWLKYIVPNKVHYRLEMEFDDEVGKGKGTWKGGTLATSVPLGKELVPCALSNAMKKMNIWGFIPK